MSNSTESQSYDGHCIILQTSTLSTFFTSVTVMVTKNLFKDPKIQYLEKNFTTINPT